MAEETIHLLKQKLKNYGVFNNISILRMQKRVIQRIPSFYGKNINNTHQKSFENDFNVHNVETKILTKLKNIVEVTEEYDTDAMSEQVPCKSSLSFVSFEQIQENKRDLIKKALKCLKECLACFRQKSKFQITINKDSFAKKIDDLKKFGIPILPLLPVISPPNKKTIVLDLDYSLVYPSLEITLDYDFTVQFFFEGKTEQTYYQKRFGLESFLFELSKIYELVVYSNQPKALVDSILSNIDNKGRISHRLYREQCLKINQTYFLKSLKILGRNQDSIIFIDSNPASGILQPSNFLLVKHWKGEPHDRQLVKIIPFLKKIFENHNVSQISNKYQEYLNIQIQLDQDNCMSQKNYVKENFGNKKDTEVGEGSED